MNVSHVSPPDSPVLVTTDVQEALRPTMEGNPSRPGGTNDSVSISEEARALYTQEMAQRSDEQASEEAINNPSGSAETAESKGDDGAAGTELSEEEQQEVEALEDRDREVRVHEQAHKAVAGAHAGAIQFEYTIGPDGQRYVIGGEVSVDISPVPGDPVATIQKMQIIRRAALAPAQPSGEDRAAAARASQIEAEARVQMAEQQQAQAEAPVSASEGGTPVAEGESPAADAPQANTTATFSAGDSLSDMKLSSGNSLSDMKLGSPPGQILNTRA